MEDVKFEIRVDGRPLETCESMWRAREIATWLREDFLGLEIWEIVPRDERQPREILREKVN